MKPTWKKYLLYGSLIIVGGGLIFLLVETIRAKNTGFETKTLWDWMELLIIPLFLAGGAFFLNRSERETERKAIEERAKLERELAADRQREIALQAYIDKISELLLEEKLCTTKKTEVRDVARTRTISVMRSLDTRRNNLVIQLLREANLNNSSNSILNHAKMAEMNLERLDLSKFSLQGVNLEKANLQGAKLVESNLQGANLQESNLRGANLGNANLQEVLLWSANLQDAYLGGANLQGAYLWGTNLEDANFDGANLKGAHLEGANLEGASITNEQLTTAKSLKDIIMPDGTKHD